VIIIKIVGTTKKDNERHSSNSRRIKIRKKRKKNRKIVFPFRSLIQHSFQFEDYDQTSMRNRFCSHFVNNSHLKLV